MCPARIGQLLQIEILGRSLMGFAWLNRTILALGVVSFFSDFGSEMATAVLPAFLVSLGASAAILGVIEGFANASVSFTSLLAGYASDYTTSRKPFAAIGYLLASLGIGFLCCLHSWVSVLFARILTRVGKGVRDPAEMCCLPARPSLNIMAICLVFRE